MTNLNVDILKDSHPWIVIKVRQTIKNLDIDPTTIAEISQTAKTAANDNRRYFKDQLDFKIAMIESLAG